MVKYFYQLTIKGQIIVIWYV